MVNTLVLHWPLVIEGRIVVDITAISNTGFGDYAYGETGYGDGAAHGYRNGNGSGQNKETAT